jgi:hypothetical protein
MPDTIDAAAFYARQGYYLHTDPVLTPDAIAAAVRGMEAVRDGHYETGVPPEYSPWTSGDDPRKLVKIEMAQQCNRAIMAAVGTAGPGQRNPSTKLTWKLTLAPGEAREVTLEYRYLVD